MKALKFLGGALDDLRAFPDQARREAGSQFYIARLADAVHVLHCFRKKTQKTPRPILI